MKIYNYKGNLNALDNEFYNKSNNIPKVIYCKPVSENDIGNNVIIDNNLYTNNYIRNRRVNRLHNNDLSFNDAINISLGKHFGKADKYQAADKLVEYFGNKKVTSNKIKYLIDSLCLNKLSFNQLEQLLRYYGYKVKNEGKVEDYVIYGKLLNEFTGLNISMDDTNYKGRHERFK